MDPNATINLTLLKELERSFRIIAKEVVLETMNANRTVGPTVDGAVGNNSNNNNNVTQVAGEPTDPNATKTLHVSTVGRPEAMATDAISVPTTHKMGPSSENAEPANSPISTETVEKGKDEITESTATSDFNSYEEGNEVPTYSPVPNRMIEVSMGKVTTTTKNSEDVPPVTIISITNNYNVKQTILESIVEEGTGEAKRSFINGVRVQYYGAIKESDKSDIVIDAQRGAIIVGEERFSIIPKMIKLLPRLRVNPMDIPDGTVPLFILAHIHPIESDSARDYVAKELKNLGCSEIFPFKVTVWENSVKLMEEQMLQHRSKWPCNQERWKDPRPNSTNNNSIQRQPRASMESPVGTRDHKRLNYLDSTQKGVEQHIDTEDDDESSVEMAQAANAPFNPLVLPPMVMVRVYKMSWKGLDKPIRIPNVDMDRCANDVPDQLIPVATLETQTVLQFVQSIGESDSCVIMCSGPPTWTMRAEYFGQRVLDHLAVRGYVFQLNGNAILIVAKRNTGFELNGTSAWTDEAPKISTSDSTPTTRDRDAVSKALREVVKEYVPFGTGYSRDEVMRRIQYVRQIDHFFLVNTVTDNWNIKFKLDLILLVLPAGLMSLVKEWKELIKNCHGTFSELLARIADPNKSFPGVPYQAVLLQLTLGNTSLPGIRTMSQFIDFAQPIIEGSRDAWHGNTASASMIRAQILQWIKDAAPDRQFAGKENFQDKIDDCSRGQIGIPDLLTWISTRSSSVIEVLSRPVGGVSQSFTKARQSTMLVNGAGGEFAGDTNDESIAGNDADDYSIEVEWGHAESYVHYVDSVYSAQEQQPIPKVPSCYNCTDPNHRLAQCPKPRDDEAIERNSEGRITVKDGRLTYFGMAKIGSQKRLPIKRASLQTSYNQFRRTLNNNATRFH